MSSSQTRYNCLINPCGKRKDFSLLTLYEHLCYHLKEKGFTEHFEYKCVPCKAFFTNKVFMVRHKMESGHEDHERMPEIDLVNPHKDEKLRRAVQLLTDDYLRYKFKVSSDGMIGMAVPGTPGTPKYGDKALYSPRTPMGLSPFAPGTPRHNEDNRVKDFSNCFANATLTPSRPLLDPVLQNGPDSPLNKLTRILPDLQGDKPHQWQVAAIREAFGIPINDNLSANAPFPNRRSNMGGNDFRPWEKRAGDCSFDRGGAADNNFDRGGRDFQSGFDTNFNDSFNRSESRRGMGMRGSREGGDRGFRRGRDRGGRGGGDRGFRGRGNFRGGSDERGRGRGRNFGGFNDQDENRQNDRDRSRSRSPIKRSAPAEDRRSYSRSPSGSPKQKSASPPRNAAPRQKRERSYSGSDRSD